MHCVYTTILCFFLITHSVSTPVIVIFHILVLLPLVYMSVFIIYWLLSCRDTWNQKLLQLIQRGRSVNFRSREHLTRGSSASTPATSHQKRDFDDFSIPNRIINPEDYANMTEAREQIAPLPNHKASNYLSSDKHLPVFVTEKKSYGTQSTSTSVHSPPMLSSRLLPSDEKGVELSYRSDPNSGDTRTPP